MPLIDFLRELEWRDMVAERTAGLPARLVDRRPLAAYVGFDPSFPSLHAGHLVPIFALAHLQRAGGRPVALIGGGTGMIGDPSGRSSERNLLDEATIDANAAAIREQLGRFLDFDAGPRGALLMDNREWLGRYGLLEFLREIGKHFTLAYMLDKESVQLRLPTGISFTEFTYMLLQAADFAHLYRHHGVEMQMGGADQWGNITAGLELIRRMEGPAEAGVERAHALGLRLITTPSGAKFGKTEGGGNLYLDARFTSPFRFYQHWINVDDRDVGLFLHTLTAMSREEIEAIVAEQSARPERRPAQRALARDITGRVHGADEARRQQEIAEAVFGERLASLDPALLATVFGEMEHAWLARGAVPATVLDFAVASGAAASRGEARRTIAQGGLYLNEQRVGDPDAPVPGPIAGEYWVVRTGRKRYRIVRLGDEAGD